MEKDDASSQLTSPVPDVEEQKMSLPSFLVATNRVHIRFSDLPVPGRLDLRFPRNGQIAQRRVVAEDDRRERFTARAWAHWMEDHPLEEGVVWREVEWSESAPHPGNRVKMTLAEGEISPKSVVAHGQIRAAKWRTTTRGELLRWLRQVFRGRA